jgi:hypothetical protein
MCRCKKTHFIESKVPVLLSKLLRHAVAEPVSQIRISQSPLDA